MDLLPRVGIEPGFSFLLAFFTVHCAGNYPLRGVRRYCRVCRVHKGVVLQIKSKSEPKLFDWGLNNVPI